MHRIMPKLGDILCRTVLRAHWYYPTANMYFLKNLVPYFIFNSNSYDRLPTKGKILLPDYWDVGQGGITPPTSKRHKTD